MNWKFLGAVPPSSLLFMMLHCVKSLVWSLLINYNTFGIIFLKSSHLCEKKCTLKTSEAYCSRYGELEEFNMGRVSTTETFLTYCTLNRDLSKISFLLELVIFWFILNLDLYMSSVSYFLETKELPQCILAISVDKQWTYFRLIGVRKWKVQTNTQKRRKWKKEGW